MEREILLDREDREIPASVIVPHTEDHNLPGWIVLHGLTPLGRFHHSLLRFVRALASSRAVVLVPQIPEWKNLRVAPEVTIPTVRAALGGLRELGITNDGPYGIIGFSFGAPQAIIATVQKDIAKQLAIVVGFGGYCDVERMAKFQMTGEHEWLGIKHHIQPDPYGIWILGGNYLTSIPEFQDARDVASALLELAVEVGKQRIVSYDPSYDVLKKELRKKISSDREWLFDLFVPPSDSEPDISQRRDLAEQLAKAMMRLSPLVDPRPYLSQISTKVHLIHGKNDQLAPYTETLRMQESFPAENLIDTTITALFTHAEQGGHLASLRQKIREASKLLLALRRMFKML
jgi:pimeloyl-ACP methyl ester carboxylesterase